MVQCVQNFPIIVYVVGYASGSRHPVIFLVSAVFTNLGGGLNLIFYLKSVSASKMIEESKQASHSLVMSKVKNSHNLKSPVSPAASDQPSGNGESASTTIHVQSKIMVEPLPPLSGQCGPLLPSQTDPQRASNWMTLPALKAPPAAQTPSAPAP
jgi:hypothetical protein